MAIEKLSIRTEINNWQTISHASASDFKINEIIDYLNSQDHIVEHNKNVEQEPNKVELVPLLPRDIVAITDEIICLSDIWKVDENRIHNILSKYWVPTPKKYTVEHLRNYCKTMYPWASIASYTYIIKFLMDHKIIEE